MSTISSLLKIWKISHFVISVSYSLLYNCEKYVTCCLTSEMRNALVGPSASTLTNSIPEPGRNFSVLICCSLGTVSEDDGLTEQHSNASTPTQNIESFGKAKT